MRLYTTTLSALAILTLCTTTLAAEDIPKKSGAIDVFIEQQAKAIGGKETGTRETSEPFDFDGLRQPDIAVLYRISKDNDTTQYVAVFEQSNDTWHLTHHIRLGGRGLRHVTRFSTMERGIEILALEFQGDDPLSSPSLKTTISFSVKNGILDITRTKQNN